MNTYFLVCSDDSKAPDPRIYPMLVTEEYLLRHLALIERDLAARLSWVVSQLRERPEVVYLVFDISAELAFSEVPINVCTYDGDRREYNCPVHALDLLPGVPLLDPRDDYPLGRVDWLGFDTTPDLELVQQAIARRLQALWALLPEDIARLQPYAGRVLTGEDRERSPSLLLNLRTGEIEAVELFDL
jgi:hypothetical protein